MGRGAPRGKVGKASSAAGGFAGGLWRGLPDLARVIEESAQRLDDWTERLTNGLEVGLEREDLR